MSRPLKRAAVAGSSRFGACQTSALIIRYLFASQGKNFEYILYEICTLYGASFVSWSYLQKTYAPPFLAPLTAVTLPLTYCRCIVKCLRHYFTNLDAVCSLWKPEKCILKTQLILSPFFGFVPNSVSRHHWASHCGNSAQMRSSRRAT